MTPHGSPEVVLQDEQAAVAVADQVGADDVDVLVVGDVDADDLAAEVPREHDEPSRDDPVPEDLLPVVDVVHEQVESLDPLRADRTSTTAHSSAGRMRGIGSNGRIRSAPARPPSRP